MSKHTDVEQQRTEQEQGLFMYKVFLLPNSNKDSYNLNYYRWFQFKSRVFKVNSYEALIHRNGVEGDKNPTTAILNY